MLFWSMTLLCNLLIPAVFIIFGRIIWKFYPKKIELKCSGFKAQSDEIVEMWNNTCYFCGKLWWYIGWGICLSTILIHLFMVESRQDVLGNVGGAICAMNCVVLIIFAFPTERLLKKMKKEALLYLQ